MRTTLTLDDVARLIREAAHQTRMSVKQVVNTALRTALSEEAPYRESVHHAELAPGLDLTGFNKLADELEDEADRVSGWRAGAGGWVRGRGRGPLR